MKGFASLCLVVLIGCRASDRAAPPRTDTVQPQVVTMYVFGGREGIKAADGHPHDAFVPSSVVVRAGAPVLVRVINYDEGPHTVTAASLGLDAVVRPGRQRRDGTIAPVETTFTFTPRKKGLYRWHCEVPCDDERGHWAMTPGYDGPDRDGFMAGTFVVI